MTRVVGMGGDEFAQEACLAGAGSADDLHDATRTVHHRFVRVMKLLEFAGSSEEADVVVDFGLRRQVAVEQPTDRERGLRVAFALDEERFERHLFEPESGVFDECLAGDEFAGLGLAHEAGSEVHGVADHGVHAAIR